MATEVVSSKDDDPVLESALSEMSSEGLLDEPGDLTADETSQTAADESADTTAAAPADATGGDRSGKAVDAPVVEGEVTDPFAGTEPFTYGDAKTPLEGVFRVPGEGLIVPEDKVSVIEQLAERADTLDRVSREYETRNADYERLSEWRTQGADGKEQVLQGREGLEAMHVQIGQLAAVVSVMDKLFDDPQRFQELVGLSQDAAGNPTIVMDPRAIRELQTEIRAEQYKRSQDIRTHLQTLVGPQAASTSAGPDWNQIAPRIIDRAAGTDSKALTAEDRTFLAGQIDRYERKITEEDRRGDRSLKVGNPIIDAKFTALVKQTANSRLAATKSAVAAEKAGKFNAGQQKGRQPASTQRQTPTAPARAEQTKTGKADWDGPLKQALEEMDIPR